MSLKQRLDSGHFATLVELDPPKGVNLAPLLQAATGLGDRVDALLISDLSDAVMRMSALGAAALLAAQGRQTIMQLSTRDRNRLALQAELLSAASLGVTNILASEGEDPSQGDHYQARPVYDLDLDELLAAINALNQGRDLAGGELEGAPDFYAGASLKLWTPGKMSDHLKMADRMASAGAKYFITPPVFDLDILLATRDKYRLHDLRIIPTVLLLKSVAMAQALRLNAKQVHMPDGLVSRLKKTKERVEECLNISAELIRGIKDAGFSGVLISPKGWEDKVPQLLDYLG